MAPVAGSKLAFLLGSALAAWNNEPEKIHEEGSLSNADRTIFDANLLREGVDFGTDHELKANDEYVAAFIQSLHSAFSDRPRNNHYHNFGRLPHCDSKCQSHWLGDGVCDPLCNNAACRYDRGDCDVELPKVAFFHIRKTGGTSLHKYLGWQYSIVGEKVCRIMSFPVEPNSCGFYDFAGSRNGMERCQVVTRENGPEGTLCKDCVEELEDDCKYVELHHWDVSVALKLKKKGYKIVTLLRHPLKLLESSYNYEAFSRTNALNGIPGYSPDFDGFETWAKDRTNITGFSTLRSFASCWPENMGKSEITEFCKILPTYYRRREIANALAGETKSQEEMYESALTAMKQIDFVGITEDFSTSINLLHSLLFKQEKHECKICPGVDENIRSNAHSHKYCIDQLENLRTRLKIRENMKYDFKLYKVAKDILSRDVEEAGLYKADHNISITMHASKSRVISR